MGSDLLVQVDEFAVDIAAYFGEAAASFDPEAANAKRGALRGRVGFDFLRFATMEYLLMLQEGVLLRSLANPDIGCSEFVTELSLSFDSRRFKARLQDKQGMFVDRVAPQVRIPFASAKTARTTGPFLESAREEVEFDIENFSSNASAKIQFLEELRGANGGDARGDQKRLAIPKAVRDRCSD